MNIPKKAYDKIMPFKKTLQIPVLVLSIIKYMVLNTKSI